MTIDYTKLFARLNAEPGAEDMLRIRVGVVSVVNADGTADVIISGVTVPDVPRLAGAAVQEGAVVQILSQRGGLLILGPVVSAGASAGLGLWARGRAVSSSASISTSPTSVLNTNTVTFLRNRVYEVRTHGGATTSIANNHIDMRAYRSTGVSIGEFYRYPLPITSTTFNTSGTGVYFAISNAANVTGAIHLYISSGAGGTVLHFASASQERNIEVWDVGDTSKFPGIVTW